MKTQSKSRKVAVISIVAVKSIINGGTIVKADELSRGYSQTCRNIAYEESTGELVARCRKIDGQYNYSYIDLDEYIANLDGKLVWTAGGNYSKSVDECEIDNSSDYKVTYLRCDAIDSSVVLDRHLENVDGQLKYYD